MIAEFGMGHVHWKTLVRLRGDRLAFRLTLPLEAEELVSVTYGCVPGPVAAADLGSAPFGMDRMGELTLRMDTPGEVVFQGHLCLKDWREENFSPMGITSPVPLMFEPRAEKAAAIGWPVEGRHLRGLYTDRANEKTGVAETYEVWVRVSWRKGGGK